MIGGDFEPVEFVEPPPDWIPAGTFGLVAGLGWVNVNRDRAWTEAPKIRAA